MSKVNMGQWNLEESSIIGPQHDSIVISCAMKAGVENLSAGTLLSVDESTGELAAAMNGNSIFGVLVRDFDKDQDNHVNVLIHGAVNRRSLERVKGESLTPQEVICLIKSGIYPL